MDLVIGFTLWIMAGSSEKRIVVITIELDLKQHIYPFPLYLNKTDQRRLHLYLKQLTAITTQYIRKQAKF